MNPNLTWRGKNLFFFRRRGKKITKNQTITIFVKFISIKITTLLDDPPDVDGARDNSLKYNHDYMNDI